ncbi:MAG: threonylcarbamoyl-AMP synthase [Chlamydiae bacterium]|nr:threonylcarbamoyl-AMP synthase [Chlamydiota bacterium]MBI3266200.1 threonylcarbamoyl-AMP synthase [Chlamydiota bacterium]
MTVHLVNSSPKILHQAALLIQQGGLVAFPTETVYGLGANALDPMAVAKIFEVKNRPRLDPIIVHVADFSQIDSLAASIPEKAKKLMEKFWPGPLTVILPKKKIVPDIVTAGLPSVALRIPNHPIALDLIRQSKCPIAAPSANPFEYLSPTTAQHVMDQIGEKVDLILDGGPCSIGVESTIIDFSQKVPCLLRPGGWVLEKIEKVIGPVREGIENPSSILAPGQMARHYSPRTRVNLISRGQYRENASEKIGLLCFRAPSRSLHYGHIEILSVSGDFKEAAANLFSALHHLDDAGLQEIDAERVPEEGLGRAIMNRLRKAAGQKNEA